MYNRYVPQSDGSFQRNRVPEPHAPPRPAPPPEPSHPPTPLKQEYSPPPRHGSVTGFLRQLLPADFDTGDLIIVLLLLLMAGDKPEDKNTALLTLALYFML